MSSRSRSYRASAAPSRASVGAPSSTPGLSQLPEYRKPQYPLSDKAQRELQRLRVSSNLQDHSKRAAKVIADAAGSINDHLREHQQRVERGRNPKPEKGVQSGEQEAQEEDLERLREDVNAKTKKLEESMRGVIDASEAAQRIEEALGWVRENAPRQMNAEYDTQTSQRRSQRNSQRDQESDEEMDQDEDAPTPGPTPLTQQRAALVGASTMFTDRLDRTKNQYSLLSHSTRYSRHNDYIGFKAIVHDAIYGDDVPLPRADTWFDERGSPAIGVTLLDKDLDEDDDLVMDKEKISLKCPIMLVPLKEPLTSRNCPHSFEKRAITEMIRTSPNRDPGQGSRGGVRFVTCPVAGCDQQLRLSDLYEDPVLQRKIKRMQEAERQAQEESEEEDEDSDIPPTQMTSIPGSQSRS